MIASLYQVFRHWSDKGSVYIISDTHFDDSDCKYMDENWITPDEHIALINKYVRKNDTFIHLGDVGNPEYIRKINGYKVLIMGNHDQSASRFSEYFDEIYTGPLMISDRILLSHEPIYNLDFCFNIHGHDHNNDNKGDKNHINLASNVCGYNPLNLGKLIKNGGISKIPTIHRLTIDERKFCTDDFNKYLIALEKVVSKRYPVEMYNIGEYQEGAVCIESTAAGWIVFNAERGNRYYEIKCDTILMACMEFIRKMTHNVEDIAEMEDELIEYIDIMDKNTYSYDMK